MTAPPPDFCEVPAVHLDAVMASARAVIAGRPICLVGPMGVGKTMIGRRLVGVLPRMTPVALIEVGAVYRVTGMSPPMSPPFRAPHHTVSSAAMARTSTVGELELSRYGILFLDEVHEFSLVTIDNLRHHLARMTDESRPRIVATSGPCPCGWLDGGARECSCNAPAIGRWRARRNQALAMLGVAESDHIKVGIVDLSARDSTERCPSTADIIATLTTTDDLAAHHTTGAIS